MVMESVIAFFAVFPIDIINNADQDCKITQNTSDSKATGLLLQGLGQFFPRCLSSVVA
jgi:hypothetical protein